MCKCERFNPFAILGDCDAARLHIDVLQGKLEMGTLVGSHASLARNRMFVRFITISLEAGREAGEKAQGNEIAPLAPPPIS